MKRRWLGSLIAGASISATLVLGLAEPAHAAIPVYVQVDAQVTNTCAVATDGTVRCWGDNLSGVLGDSPGFRLVPGALQSITGATQVSVGNAHACARLSTGGVRCWGTNLDGRLGNGTQTSVTSTPVAPTGITDATAVAAGAFHSCALLSGGTVKCWGDNATGLIGDGTTAMRTSPTSVSGVSGATQIDNGDVHTCALLSGGTVKCWGWNVAGALGDGTTAERLSPVTVSGLTGVTQIAAGSGHTCAVVSAGAVKCWGSNSGGALGDGTTTNRPSPVSVTGLSGVTKLFAGGSSNCAVLSNGDVKCWGWNGEGQLNDGTTTNRTAPVTVSGLSGLTTWSAYSHACAVASSGQLNCWGDNLWGQLGDNTTTDRLTPGPVAVPPSAPGTPTVASGPNQLIVSWTPPASTSGLLVTGYWITPYIDGIKQGAQYEPGDGTSHILLAPSLGHAYTFTVAAETWAGVGAESTLSTPFVPSTVPGTPSGVSAVAGNGAATVKWTAPANGGKPITGYTVTPFIGGVAQAPRVFASTATSQVIANLTNGTAYTFKVAATNANGTGSPSAASSAVTPVAYGPFGSWSAMVNRLFVDLTAKAPTSAESSSWVSSLGNGSQTKGQLVDALRRGGENTSNVDPAARLYRAFLARTPDAGGLKFWVGRRRGGSWTLTRMADSFASSSEFKAKYGALTNRQFVTRIYTDVLGRTADPAGVDYWTRQLDLKRRTRGSVMVGFSESNEYKVKQAENTDVAVAYIFLLGRAPTTAEVTDWTTRQKNGTPHATLATELLDSAGYATHIAG